MYNQSNILKTMHPNEVNELHYLLLSNQTQFPSQFGFSTSNIAPLYNQLSTISNPSYQFQTNPQIQDINPQSTYFSSNSTSDEADEQQLSIINERKQRRMISNRESARRSRMRKQKQLDELWSQVVCLRNENHQLMDKLNRVSESHDQAIEENARLKEETSELRRMITDLKLGSPYDSLRELDDDACNDLPKPN